MKGIQLITSIGEFIVEETREEIIAAHLKSVETNSLDFTVKNTVSKKHARYDELKNQTYKISLLAALYRGVREVEMPEEGDHKPEPKVVPKETRVEPKKEVQEAPKNK